MDCIEQLEWRNWQPGTEYYKNLVLKNVTTTTVKVKYKQTHSKAFSMEFPEPIKLRPGMSHSLKVSSSSSAVGSGRAACMPPWGCTRGCASGLPRLLHDLQ